MFVTLCSHLGVALFSIYNEKERVSPHAWLSIATTFDGVCKNYVEWFRWWV